MLTWAEKHIGDIDETVLTNEQRQQSLMLWSLLAQLLHGRAYEIVRSVPEGEGLQAWRKLYFSYQLPDQVAKQTAMLVGLMEPKWGKDAVGFLDKFYAWENQIAQLQAHGNIQVPDSIKCAILMSKTPPMIRKFLAKQSLQT